jgi:hypothetical protein
MMLIRLILVAFGGVLGLSCAAEELGCPRVVGQFQPLYTPLSGTCGPFADPMLVKIDDVPQASQTSILMFGNGRLTTEVVLRGCSVQMIQQFEASDRLQTYLEARELSVESADELAGQVSMFRYGTDGNVSCWGVYQARLLKEKAAIGAAVGAAATGVSQ